jgi:hypothetical protein
MMAALGLYLSFSFFHPVHESIGAGLMACYSPDMLMMAALRLRTKVAVIQTPSHPVDHVLREGRIDTVRHSGPFWGRYMHLPGDEVCQSSKRGS